MMYVVASAVTDRRTDMQTHKTTIVTLWCMRRGLMTFKCMAMVRRVFHIKTRNVRLHVSKKEWGGGRRAV